MSTAQEGSPKKPKRPRGKVRLIPGKCIACGGRCQAECPVDAITLNEKGEPVIDLEKCIGCGKCLKVCPADAIERFYTPEEKALLAEMEKSGAAKEDPLATDKPTVDESYRGVWVFVEEQDGVAAQVSWELLGVGRTLAKELETALCAFILGDKIEPLAQEAFAYGADKVYLINDPILHDYRTETYVRGMVQLVRKYKPEVVLIGATGLGRDLAGAAATTLESGLTADCTGLTIDRKNRLLEQTRPAFGGNIMATILTRERRPQMASVRPHVLPKPEPVPGRMGEIIREKLHMTEEEVLVKILQVIREKQGDHVDIAGAEVLVSGGRGMQGPESFRMLQELADLLGGTISSSRAAVDAGWISSFHQVGQTGKTVRPKIYIACGISGAIQHLVGMQDSDLIIAINRDREAPIFEVAHFGIVGDVFQLVPALIRKFREIAREGRGSAEGSDKKDN